MLFFLLAICLAALTGWLVEAVASGSIERAVSAFRELIGGWRPDPWPRGVQEEDRDRPWARGVLESIKPAVQGFIDSAQGAVATTQVKSRTRPRSP